TLKDFQVTFIAAGERTGQALDYQAALTVRDAPDAPAREAVLKVNQPLEVGGTQTYLISHGYAPTFKVTDGKGQVAWEGPVPCLISDRATYASECVIKVPDARPEQLGLLIRFLPTGVPAADDALSALPVTVTSVTPVFAFGGDVGH